MLIYKLSPDLKKAIQIALKDPVFRLVFAEYEIDNDCVYIPRERISNIKKLETLISTGIIKISNCK